jgi:RNA polymerase primary sigma factor
MVADNIGLAYAMARRFRRNIPEDDAVSDCMMGLAQSARWFDPQRGFKFSTYACRAMLVEMIKRREKIARQARLVKTVDLTGDRAPDQRPDGSLRVDARDAWLLIDKLPSRIGFVIRQRMEGKTLQAIGDVLGLTKERVRQMELEAIHSLRELADVEEES